MAKNSKSHKHINKLLILFAVAVALLGVITLMVLNSFQGPRLSAVYLETGDLYFGYLSQIPFGLRQVYTLQVNPQSETTPINIQRFKNVFWGPEDFLKLNRDQVVWIAKLGSESELARLIRTNPDLTPPAESPSIIPNDNASILENE